MTPTGLKAVTPPEDGRMEAHASVRATPWPLPEGQHQAFLLRHRSGLAQEIADILDGTPAPVESLLISACIVRVSNRDTAAGERVEVRRLVDTAELATRQPDHPRNCHRCRSAQAQLHAGGIAAALALAPSSRVAHKLSELIPGFNPRLASESASAPLPPIQLVSALGRAAL